MGGRRGQKIRLLYLADILKQYTDDDHPLSAAELIEKLEEKDISVERKAIYDDISVLCEYGMDIINTRVPRAGYYLASRDFEVPEIHILSDAVQAAGFISYRKTRELVGKLNEMLSKNQAGEMGRRVYIDNRNKCTNEEIFYNIDAASRAIAGCKKLSLRYCRRGFDESGKITQNERVMTVSPYALCWSGDHYYLVCNYEKYDNLMQLRLDRMKKVTVTEQPWRHFSEVSEYTHVFDVADYAQKSFNMFGGELQRITLRCRRELLEQIIDRFTDKISIRDVDAESFSFSANALISDGLIDWIMQFGAAVTVLEPHTLRSQVEKTAREICKNYEK